MVLTSTPISSMPTNTYDRTMVAGTVSQPHAGQRANGSVESHSMRERDVWRV